MTFLRIVVVACLMFLPTLGGCMQRVAVEGRSDQLYAEAKGAMESEGFRPVGRDCTLAGAKGNCRAEGRLQFLYYADNIVPTIVEIKIEPSPEATLEGVRTETAAAGAVRGADGRVAAAGQAGPTAVGGVVPAAGAAMPSGVAPGSVAAAPSGAAGARTAAKAAAFNGPHSVAISAWSSLTYAPDPWITDLALGVIRRAYLLSGNIR